MAVDVWQGVPQPAMEGEPDGEGQKCSRPAKHLPCLAAANGQHGRAKARVGRKARNGNRERRPWVVGVLVVRVVILAFASAACAGTGFFGWQATFCFATFAPNWFNLRRAV
jgi:hypothetical protein